jgi:hypothetical protein
MEVNEEKFVVNEDESNDENKHSNKQKSYSNESICHTNNVFQVKSTLPQTLHHRTSSKLQPNISHSIDSRHDDNIRINEKENFITNFSQQKLHAWQPVLTTGWIVSFFFVFGFIFTFLGEIFYLF